MPRLNSPTKKFVKKAEEPPAYMTSNWQQRAEKEREEGIKQRDEKEAFQRAVSAGRYEEAK
jgi:hypothetical protein